MANYFEITAPDGLSVVKLDSSGQAKVQYTVKNVSGIKRDGRAVLVSLPNTPGAVEKNWVKIEGPSDKAFNSGQSQTYVVTITVPRQSPPGTYGFRLDVVLVAKPDEGDQSSPLAFNVTTAAGGKSFPWWILVVALVVLVVLGVVLWLALSNTGSKSGKGSGSQQSGSGKSGAEKVSVPDLTGKTPAQAETALQSAGLKLDSTYGSVTTSDNSQVGKVEKQSPAAGAQAAKDSSVKIYVANKAKGL